MTNFEKITAKPVELAKFFDDMVMCPACFLEERCLRAAGEKKCFEVFADWMNEEAENDGG